MIPLLWSCFTLSRSVIPNYLRLRNAGVKWTSTFLESGEVANPPKYNSIDQKIFLFILEGM